MKKSCENHLRISTSTFPVPLQAGHLCPFTECPEPEHDLQAWDSTMTTSFTMDWNISFTVYVGFEKDYERL